MVSSRKIDDLLTPVKLRVLPFLAACNEAGIELVVTCTYRDEAAQAALYARGRTAPGAIVTCALPGESFHQWRCALDVVPIVCGKAVWDDADPLWQKIGAIGESCDLEWAGRWTHNREFPHFQFTGGVTVEQFRAGATIPPEFTHPIIREVK